MGSELNETVRNRQVILRDFVVSGSPKESDLLLNTGTARLKVPDGSDNAVLLKNLYLSCDPTMGIRMRNIQVPGSTLFFDPGSPIRGYGVARVLDSRNPNFGKGDLVWGLTTWEEYSLITEPAILFRIEHADVPLSYYTGLLGTLAPFLDHHQISKSLHLGASSLTWVVMFLLRYARTDRIYRIFRYMLSKERRDRLRFSSFWSGRTAGWPAREVTRLLCGRDVLSLCFRCFPDGIDIYFDNVGGKMLDAVLLNMKIRGRIAACGMISQYNLDHPEAVHNLMNIVLKQIRMEGFLTSDRFHLYPKFLDLVLPQIRQGKIDYVEDISYGLESGPGALVGLFSGRNIGKQVVVVAHE